MPATASYSQGLAYGRGGSSARAQTDEDAPLFAEAHTAPAKKPIQRKRTVDQAPPTRSEPVTPTQEQTPVAPPAAKQERTDIAYVPEQPVNQQLALADTSVVSRYEAREAQSQSQQQFQGGDAIVIGASTLVIIILIVLLVLLLV